MGNIIEWQKRWNIPQQAIDELLATAHADSTNCGAVSESAIQQQVRLTASKQGSRLWRNNNGVAVNPKGQPVRYGLANESSKINRVMKSSDLIGITPHMVTLEDVGKTVGVFTAVEVKKSSWVYSGTPREIAQLKFILLVQSLGGIGRFNNDGNF